MGNLRSGDGPGQPGWLGPGGHGRDDAVGPDEDGEGRVVGEGLQAGGPPSWTYDLRGTGIADAILVASQTSDGLPIVSYSAVYTFRDDPAATPEPGTLVLFGSAAAGLVARRRRMLRR